MKYSLVVHLSQSAGFDILEDTAPTRLHHPPVHFESRCLLAVAFGESTAISPFCAPTILLLILKDLTLVLFSSMSCPSGTLEEQGLGRHGRVGQRSALYSLMTEVSKLFVAVMILKGSPEGEKGLKIESDTFFRTMVIKQGSGLTHISSCNVLT